MEDVQSDWRDPGRDWWVKLRRAGSHIAEARAAIDDLRRSGAFSIAAVPSETARRVDYRFRLGRAVPPEVRAVIADAIHNLRSAMDYVAFAIAIENRGNLTAEQEKKTAFPICETRNAFDTAMQARVTKGQPETLADLYGERGLTALRSVQPFWFAQEAARYGITREMSSVDDLHRDALHRLNHLWNIDKHRRLPGLSWLVRDAWWPGDAGEASWSPGVAVVAADGDVVGSHLFRTPSQTRPMDVRWEVGLTLTDDPSPYPADVVTDLANAHMRLGGWVVPRVFITLATGEPPVIIAGGWPYGEAR